MTLLKFIEYQRRGCILNRLPLVVKLMLLIYVLLSVIIPVDNTYIFWSLGLILIAETIMMLVCFRDPFYLAEIYMAYGLLFIFAYLSVLFCAIEMSDLLYRLLYVYTVAFTTIFVFSTTKVEQIEAFLRKIGTPEKILNFLTLAWNLIPSTYSELQLVRMAQAARGVEIGGHPLRRIKQSIVVLIPFLLLLLLRSRLLEISLRARGVE